MKHTFCLITNASGVTYWSKRCDYSNRDALTGFLRAAQERYGVIYVNENGGWFPESSVNHILKTVEQKDFPR